MAMICLFVSGILEAGWGRAYAVPEPVGGGGETYTTGSDWEREDLANNDPGTWSPRGSEHGDVDADERNHSVDGTVIV